MKNKARKTEGIYMFLYSRNLERKWAVNVEINAVMNTTNGPRLKKATDMNGIKAKNARVTMS